MKHITFGANQQASVIAAGTMRIAGMDEKTADTFVRSALDAGVNFFDHADIYGGGKSEEVFGGLLQKDASLRKQMLIQSKCGIRSGYFDFSREHIIRSVDGSLKRLQTDYLDCLLLHRPDALMEPEEVQQAFETLHKAGKVLSFGVSNMNPMQMQLLKTGVTFPIAANQVQMSIAHTPMLDAAFNVNMSIAPAINRDGGVLEYCRMNDIAVQAWSPLQYGFFEGTFLGSEKYPELNRQLEALAEKYRMQKDTIAYAWLLRYPAKMQVITGTTNPDRLRSAARAADVTLTREEWYALYRAAGNKLP
ncbi:MAG: aldo/keto reductase [Clostridia bacterium]|nr:aldo/keto reductase [Clostridia bacterium]